MLTTCWETGLQCSGCQREIALGEELLYGRCLSCAQDAARARNAVPGPAEVLARARERLAVPGRIVLSRSEIRVLIALACAADPSFAPVHRPDRRPVTKWYARLAGWDAARVARGLSAAETAGMWLDFLAVGRVPAVRHGQLAALLEAVGAQKEQDSRPAGGSGDGSF